MKGIKIKRTLPPAGAPILLQDFLQAIRAMFHPAKVFSELKKSLSEFFGVKHIFLLNSGKAALTVILEALADIDNRREVVVPSYTCFSVPASVARAGLKNVICDIQPFTVNYDASQLRNVLGINTLCVLVSHLFGIPSDIEALSAMARPHGVFLIEDCAQAFGAELNGKKIGTAGDVAFLSFGRGKNICAGSGGVIVTNNDLIAQSLDKRVAELPYPQADQNIQCFVKALFLSIFSCPYLYWLPAGLPFLQLGKTIYSTRFRIEHMLPFHAGLAENWQAKLKLFNSLRRMHAETYKNELMPLGFRFFKEPEVSVPVYPRFPVIAHDVTQRDYLFERLSLSGLGGSFQYPAGIAHIPELSLKNGQRQIFRNGDLLAKLLITLPTHPGVSQLDIQAIVRIFQECRHNANHLAYVEKVS
jgi:perosamine synthetase